MKILISGTSGLIGTALYTYFKGRGDDVWKLVHAHPSSQPQEIHEDMLKKEDGLSELEGLDVAIQLAGESIIGRWTPQKKEKIKKSRVNGTKKLSEFFCKLKKPPKVFICASAVGYYGNRGDEILTEESPKGEGFLSDVCDEWENATLLASNCGIRTLHLRLGMVLSAKGGALKQMLSLFRWGMGASIGNGTQIISWIALEDVVSVVEKMIEQENERGPVNVVSPYCVSNKELTDTLGSILHQPTFFKIPPFMVKMLLGEMGEELLLASAHVIPKKLLESHFQFKYPHLEHALRHAITLGP